MLLVDTNIFLELIFGQKKAEECQKFLEKIACGELKGVVSRFTLHAIEAKLKDSTVIFDFLSSIENSSGVVVYETSLEDEKTAALLMERMGLDFDDALHYYISKKLGVEAIVSYDKHFDKCDIKRKEPSEFL